LSAGLTYQIIFVLFKKTHNEVAAHTTDPPLFPVALGIAVVLAVGLVVIPAVELALAAAAADSAV
jgi:hypothetical protein